MAELQRVAVRCNVLQPTIKRDSRPFQTVGPACCRTLQCVVVCCNMLKYVLVCCSVLQCVALCCSVLHCVAVCCSLCGRAGLFETPQIAVSNAVCSNVLQPTVKQDLRPFQIAGQYVECVEMYCSVLQCDVVGRKNCRWFDRVHAREFG